MWSFSFSFLLLFLGLGFGVLAQTDTARVDSLSNSKTSRTKKVRPDFFLGLDVSRPFVSGLSTTYSGMEVMAGMALNQTIYSMHAGQVSHSIALSHHRPLSEGLFFGLTASRNLFPDPKNALCMGGRVMAGFWRYKPEQIKLKNDLINEEWQVDGGALTGQSVWVEFVPALRTQVWRWVQMGFEIRLKARLWNFTERVEEVYHLPGYGRFDQPLALGFNYFLYFQLFAK